MTLIKNKYLNFLIKTALILLLCWALYQQVFARENLEDLKTAFLNHFRKENLHWLIFATALMPLNWAFESLKWHQLIKHFESLNFWSTYKGIFAGVTLSLFTPNRIGEYGGRILVVEAKNNWKAVIATLVGSFSQLLVLMSMGLLGLVYFILHYMEVETYLLQSAIFLGIGLIGLMLFCFFNIDLVIPIVRRLPFAKYFRRFVKHVKILKEYHTRDLAMALTYAFARYLTYTLQYYLMLRFFAIEAPLLPGLASIATIFLLQTSIPLPPVMGLLARGEIALFIWQHFSSEEVNILAATFGLFILNLIIPGLIGIIFIVNINVLKSLGYEKEQV
ncbi:MAG: lysylphosphatidylglycerol synthase transmembrane domain-containing protein [Bacteroidota bacterium]